MINEHKWDTVSLLILIIRIIIIINIIYIILLYLWQTIRFNIVYSIVKGITI